MRDDTALRLTIGPTAVNILCGDLLAGRYVYADEFKPYLHPLNTPRGHTLSLAMPHDHKHHKGLMYALKTADVNFWEEVPGPFGDKPGVQRHDTFTAVSEKGSAVGFVEELTWLAEDGTLTTFRETRTLSCRALPQCAGFEWTWTTELEAHRDVRLVMSNWSARKDDDTLVNYHGLGIRLRRDFGCTRGNELRLDRLPTAFKDGMGRVAEEVSFHGRIDGSWPPPRAGVRFRQEQANTLFAMETPFAFMSLGPTNHAPLELAAGEKLRERYVVTVFDDEEGM